MDIRQQFPDLHWLADGGISVVYEVHPDIVVKVPKSGAYEREQFRKEVKIYEIISQHPPCPYLVQCFLYGEKGIFLRYMRGAALMVSTIYRTYDLQTGVVTKVDKLEPLSLRKEWMNDLAQAVAFLESLNLAHGDLRPENILIDHNRLKLTDFDSTAEIGSCFEACIPPYGRILNSNEQNEGSPGKYGSLGPRTELFALGSLYYLINYGFEVYGDRLLTEDPKKQGNEVVKLLQNMVFPELNGDTLLDNIISKCWHNNYATVAELAAYTATLLPRAGEQDGYSGVIEQHGSAEEFSANKTFCQDLEDRGLLHMLSLGEPKQLGLKFEWYRHSTR
ncbi:hypothetical protein N7535_004600 [Penicillium sp. DV-2018c]|nr:hypothetical protein N7461_008180 [Penicillium sp. DV-2018c]KAJ5570940.1 hypothetical protein N7535_004600 [Penicillium sp. DV-2018c]